MFRLPEKVTIWNPVANDGHGGTTWSAPAIADARIAYKREKTTDTNGDDFMSKAVFYARAAELVIGSKVFFGESTAVFPPSEADDVVNWTNTPSGAADLKKGWI